MPCTIDPATLPTLFRPPIMRLVSLDGPINVKEQTDGAAALDCHRWMHTARMAGAARSCGCFVTDSGPMLAECNPWPGCRPFISRLTSSVVDQSAKTD